MRSTTDINYALLAAAKSHAARSQKTLVEQALLEFLSEVKRPASDAPPIPVFRGMGVQPGVNLTDNAALEELLSAKF